MRHTVIAVFALLAACSVPVTPAPADKPSSPRYETEQPTEVVELPWQGEVIEREEFCRPPRDPVLDTTTSVFRRVEIRKGGLELIERAVYRGGEATEVVVHGSGCTHDTMTITFVLRDKTAPGDVDDYRKLAVVLLRGLPVTGDGPSYPEILAGVLASGTPDPETPNLIRHEGDAIVTFDVGKTGDGAVELKVRYDFPM